MTIQAAFTPDAGVRYPICIAGQRACAPDGCDGIEDYADLTAILQDSIHPGYYATLNLLGDHFDPERYDVDRTNEVIADALR